MTKPAEDPPGPVLAARGCPPRARLPLRQIGSAALRADSVLTIIAAALAAGALLGLILTDAFGWWWADSTIALAMVGVLLREGFGVLRVQPGDNDDSLSHSRMRQRTRP
jgi:hypothetical protein